MRNMLVQTLLLYVMCSCSYAQDEQPNIIFVVVDDLGYYDTSLFNPLAITPTLKKMATEGVFLNQSYVQPICTPSRAAILSGKYTFNTGMQNPIPILPNQPMCLNTSLPLISDTLKGMGYATHAIGKWHVGFCDVSCLPTRRGFDSFLGYFNAYSNFYTKEMNYIFGLSGIDMFEDEQGNNATWGIHSTDLYSDRAVNIINTHDKSSPLFVYLAYQAVHFPVQAPDEYLRMYDHVDDGNRRGHMAMTTHLDDGLGRVIRALEDNNMADNTILVLVSDNGATPAWGGYNHPLRGGKSTLWEGGIRSHTLAWGGALQKTNYVNDGLIHAVDWYPTLVSMAGGNTDDLDLDGIDSSAMLVDGEASQREVLVHQIGELAIPYQGAIRRNQYKFMIGMISVGGWDGWYDPPELNCSTLERPPVKHVDSRAGAGYNYYFPAEWDRYLFDVKADPEERENLIDVYTEVAEELEWLLSEYEESRVDTIFPMITPRKSNPDNFGGFWSPGWCDDINADSF